MKNTEENVPYAWCRGKISMSIINRSLRFHPRSWHRGFKETNVSFPLTRKDSVLNGASVADRHC